ncbi:MAG: hypothetical protein K2N34_01800 [Lachnospiraceae bacterium]|nr:hypothetical protein [Lachnospiraceae bacterium]
MKKILTNNIGFKLLSLLFAIVFWLIVVNIDDPVVTRTIQGIPVTTLDENVITGNSQVYKVASGNEVTITVKGPRSMVDRMTKDDFLAEAPFSEKSNVDAVPIYVSFRNSKYDKDCEITQKTMSMKLEIENIVNKTFEININHVSELSSAYYLGKESITPQTVSVSAPESIINQIERVTVDADLSNHTSDFSMPLSIKFFTGTGSEVSMDANTSLNTSTVTYSANIYHVREVTLKCGYVGNVADGYELVDIVSEKSTIRIAGPDAHLIDNIVLPDELLNVSRATADVSVEADIAALLPSGVYLCNPNDAIMKITAKIEKLVTSTYRIPVSEIDKNNIPYGYNAEISEQNISLRLIGLERAHSSFSVNDLDAYVDLKNTVEGNNEVIVRFTLPNNLKLVEEVRVNVFISKDNTAAGTTTTPPATGASSGNDTSESTTAPIMGNSE